MARPKLYLPSMNDQVYKLCLLGATDKQIADFFEVDERTINNWKISEPEFFQSIRRGKEHADMNVAEALYKKATGYEQETVKIFQFQGESVIVPYTEKIQPDTAAAFIWLKNRQGKQWRDKQELEVAITELPKITLKPSE